MPTARNNIPRFHLAAPITSKDIIREFYEELLGCSVGREAPTWIDFDFFGHQLSFHVKDQATLSTHPSLTNKVDGKDVPVHHFGVILPWGEWKRLSKRLIKANIDFIIEPYIRFKGEIGEQATMFFLDPSGHALEFKSFKNDTQIFAA